MDKIASKERIEHILQSIAYIHEFMQGVREDSFLLDVKLQSAIQYQFLIVGEATRFLDNDLLEKYSYPWHIPKSFRNFIIHEYFGVKMELIFQATQELDELEMQLGMMLKNEF
jgi:uncharacterized protein with HEPN domain